jgi:hypothetical protein
MAVIADVWASAFRTAWLYSHERMEKVNVHRSTILFLAYTPSMIFMGPDLDRIERNT